MATAERIVEPKSTETMIKGITNFLVHLCLMHCTSKIMNAASTGNSKKIPKTTRNMTKAEPASNDDESPISPL